MQQTTCTRICISIEVHRTSRNVICKQEHVTDTIESDRRKKAVCR